MTPVTLTPQPQGNVASMDMVIPAAAAPLSDMLMPALQPLQILQATPETLPPQEQPPADDDHDSDPQVLLDLLLDVAAQPVQPEIAVNTVVPQPVEQGTDMLPSAQTVVAAQSAPAPAAEQVGAAAEQQRAVPVKAPLKLTSTRDAVLASKAVQQALQTSREEGVHSLQAPASPLVTAIVNKEDLAAARTPTIALPTQPEAQAEALKKALGERLEMQIDQRSQKATIRLDPPQLGKLDISIHYESGKLQVQIQAAQPEITRLLQQISSEMRASLSEQHHVQVNVQVSTQSGDSRQPQQQQRHQYRQDAPIANNNEEVTLPRQRTDGTLLTMV
ncbi:flagellar hook-length control protein FliK [Erwinia oleae]|uniref:flagellar hook-length control protein FliK n=1 Tax=Erwinia oleae TaxID=796334 RepID=UPI00068E9566|nr:flagellar hook-length control protein FliK [Erwinia oleae]